MDDPEILALLPAIAEQLDSAETPFVQTAYQDLIQEVDIDDQEARYMLAFCLADEIEKMNTEERAFDLSRYQMLIALLPTLPQ